MHQALWLLLETVGSLLATACLLRAYQNRLGLGARNPIGQFVVAITDWIVKPLRRMIPASRANDWASIVAAFAIAVVLAILFAALFGIRGAAAPGSVFLLAVFWLIKWSLWLLTVLVFAQVVLSWVNPYAPIAPTISSLTAPFLAPIRRIVPLIGGVDLSPLVLILLVQFALTLLQSLIPGALSLAG